MGIQYEELFRRVRNLSPYGVEHAIREALGDDTQDVGAVMWEGVRRGLWAPSHTNVWSAMARTTVPYDGALLAKLLVDGNARGLHDELLKQASQNIHVWWLASFWKLVLPVKHDLAPVAAVWRSLDEPLRTFASYALAWAGALSADDLEAHVLPRIATSWVENSASYQEYRADAYGGVESIWTEGEWGLAVCQRACERDWHYVLPSIQKYFRHVPLDVRVGAAVSAAGEYLELVVKLVLDMGDEAFPVLARRADAMLASMAKTHSAHSVGLVTAWLEALARRGETLDPKYDPLVTKAAYLRYPALTRALGHLPPDRREKVIVEGSGYFHVAASPTAAVVQGVVEHVHKWGYSHQSYYDEHKDCLAALDTYAELARPAILKVLPGSQAPYRHFLVRALGKAPSLESVPLLVALLQDTSPRHGERDASTGRVDHRLRDVPEFAAEALQHVARAHGTDPVLAGLEALLKSKKADARAAAVAAMKLLPSTDALRRRANELLAKEKRDDIRAALKTLADAQGEDPAEKLPEELRAAWPKVKEHILAASLHRKECEQWADLLARFRDDRASLALAWESFALHPKSPVQSAGEFLRALRERFPEGYRHLIARVAAGERPPAVLQLFNYAWGDEHLPLLVAGLADASAAMRKRAAEAIKGFSGSPKLFIPLLRHPDEGVRLAAAQRFVKWWETRDHAAALRDALAQETSDKVARVLRDALEGVGDVAVEVELPDTQDAAGDAKLDAWMAAQRLMKHAKPLDAFEPPALRWKTGAALSPKAVHWLLDRLQEEDARTRGASLAKVRARLDDGDCARLYDELAEVARWARWVNMARGVLGGDDAIESYAASVESSMASRHTVHATEAVAVLRRSRSDRALAWLSRWSHTARSAALRERSAEALAEVAKERALHPDAVADMSVPSFGFDAKGVQPLAVGDATWTVEIGRDRALQLKNAKGAAVKKFPTGKTPEERKALNAARARWNELHKGWKSTLAEQTRRLRGAMIAGRRWAVTPWRQWILGHPMMSRLAQGMLWETRSGGAPAAYFRVTDDGRCVGLDAHEVALGESVALAHLATTPAEAVFRWRETLKTLDAPEAFAQAHREVRIAAPVDPDEALEAAVRALGAFQPVALRGALKQLEYDHGAPGSGGFLTDARRRLTEDVAFVITHGPIDITGSVTDPVTVDSLRATRGGAVIPWKDAPASMVSEALVDLEALGRRAL